MKTTLSRRHLLLAGTVALVGCGGNGGNNDAMQTIYALQAIASLYWTFKQIFRSQVLPVEELATAAHLADPTSGHVVTSTAIPMRAQMTLLPSGLPTQVTLFEDAETPQVIITLDGDGKALRYGHPYPLSGGGTLIIEGADSDAVRFTLTDAAVVANGTPYRLQWQASATLAH
jgi:hypothetical protein